MKAGICALLSNFIVWNVMGTESSVPLYRWPIYSSDILSRVSNFLNGETFEKWDYGSIYEAVPQKYAERLGAKYGFFCSSGTSGLHASLMAIGLKRGDRVVVPAMTFIRSITPIVHLGLEPVLVDVDAKTGNLDPAALLLVNDPKVKAVIVVHMWGVPAKMDEICKIAQQKGWKIIEDFSHAHFSKTESKYVGSIGDIGFCSLQRKKTLSVGEGGLIVTNDEDTFKRVRQIVSPGSFDNPPDTIDFSGFGLNMRMSPTSVILAEGLFEHIDEIINTRSGSANRIISMMAQHPELFEVPVKPDHVDKISWYVLRVKTPLMLDKLKAAAVGTRWKFGDLDCPMIADHIFWNKDKDFYPFSEKIKIVNPNDSFPGAKEYLQGRISVGVPNLAPEQWTDEEVLAWGKDLLQIVEKVQN